MVRPKHSKWSRLMSPGVKLEFPALFSYLSKAEGKNDLMPNKRLITRDPRCSQSNMFHQNERVLVLVCLGQIASTGNNMTIQFFKKQ